MLEKLSSERWGVGFDFTGKLPTGASISSGTATATDLSDNSDVSATLLVSTTASISGNVATVRLQSGTKGRKYLVLLTVVLSTGAPADTLTESLVVSVLDW
jgi:hypothetical protein